MISLPKNDKMKNKDSGVRLLTYDPELTDIMLQLYPGDITGEQYAVKSDLRGKLHQFSALEEDTLLGFLKQYERLYDFEVLDDWNELKAVGMMDFRWISSLKYRDC